MKYFLFFIAWALVFAYLAMLGGCGYNKYSEDSSKIAVAETDMKNWQTDTIMTALSQICGVFDNVVKKQNQADESAPLMTIATPTIDGTLTTTTVYHPPADRSTAIILSGVAKSMVIRELYPIIKELTRDLSTKLQRPITWQEVALRIADDTGMLASIGGMYGLGKAGIDAAQGMITANLSGGSSFSKDGAKAAGNYQPWTDNSVKTEHSPLEAE